MKYRVCFTQWYMYTVEADSENDAIELAEEDFINEMRMPIANTTYDEVEAWAEEQEDT